nr:MAG TPA: hypothetical protein [Caudoviricetes sp.]
MYYFPGSIIVATLPSPLSVTRNLMTSRSCIRLS